MLIDDDIDKIIQRGESRTAQLTSKYDGLNLDDLNNFKSESMVTNWEGEDFQNKVCFFSFPSPRLSFLWFFLPHRPLTPILFFALLFSVKGSGCFGSNRPSEKGRRTIRSMGTTRKPCESGLLKRISPRFLKHRSNSICKLCVNFFLLLSRLK